MIVDNWRLIELGLREGIKAQGIECHRQHIVLADGYILSIESLAQSLARSGVRVEITPIEAKT